MWYSDRYRRHLIDMHIEEWDDEFLSEFSPEEYVENLKIANINYAMVYLQSHVGLCYYPTKTGDMHKALINRPDAIKRVVDLCHKNDIKVMGYYSLIYNTREHDKHPDWRMVTESGRSKRSCNDNSADKGLAFQSASGSRYGFCCPNNQEYREFVYAQIDEMLEYFDCDALFFDMPFFAYTCYCDKCKDKYQQMYGNSMPENPAVGSDGYLSLVQFKHNAMGDFISSVTNYIKSKAPDLPVEYNFASSLVGGSFNGCGYEVADASDFVGGDLYGDQYNHSFVCKFLKANTKNMPFENMISRCKPALQTHTLSRTAAELKTSMAITMAHHGASLVIDAIDPCGSMDERVYHRFGEVFGYEQQYEKYFYGDMIEDVGIYWGFKSFINTNGISGKTGCMGASRAFTAHHIPHGVCGRMTPLDKYKIIIAPYFSSIETEDQDRIESYVKNGGVIYFSGFENIPFFEKLTGNRFIEKENQIYLYAAPTDKWASAFGEFTKKYPLPFTVSDPTPIVESETSEVIATLTYPYTKFYETQFASIHSNPPGISTNKPAITVNRYGKGYVVWSALPIESIEHPEFGDVLINILNGVKPLESSVKSTAPANVEITAFKSENDITVNAVILNNESYEMSVYPFEISVKCEREPKSVVLLPSEENIDFSYKDGYVTFETKKLITFDMYMIKF